jgi:hypothetical protein
MSDFETDSNGDIITKPVTGWITAPVAEIAVLLAIQYVETPEELEKGNSKQIQLVLMPQKCLELAEALTKAGKSLLEDQSHSEKPAN